MMTIMETYKEITNTMYSVSNYGNIRNNNTNRVLKPKLSKSGYYYVDLYYNSKSRQYSVHRLVALYHVDNPHNYNEVNHINEIKTDNNAGNLEWCTHYQNMHHGNIGKRHISKQVKVYQYTLDNQFIREFDSCKEAEITFGKTSSNISNCCRGKLKTAYGFKWSYSPNQSDE